MSDDYNDDPSLLTTRSSKNTNTSSYTLLTEISVDDYGNVVIPETFKKCEIDSDCIAISNSCTSCTCGEPIDKIYAEDYYYTFSEICTSTEEICDMGCMPMFNKCLNGLCAYSETE